MNDISNPFSSYTFDQLQQAVLFSPPPVPWQVVHNILETSYCLSPTKIQRALSYGPWWLPQYTWLFNHGQISISRILPPVPLPSQETLQQILAQLTANTFHQSVYWTKTTGFMPRIGTLGLAFPLGDYTFAWNDGKIIRIIIGTHTPFGQGAIIFPNLQADAAGNIHPQHVYLLAQPFVIDSS